MSFSSRVVDIISSIPEGRIVTYGQVAAMAGNPRAARGVVWILRSSSRSRDLPWHRVVAAGGRIALSPAAGGAEQIARLESEGVAVCDGYADIASRLWRGPLEP